MGLCSIVLLVPLFVFQLVADEDAADSKAWQERRQAEFAEYEIAQLGPDGEVAVKFETNSLLNWSNPIRRSPAGAVYLWTIAGRPQLIASTYPYKGGIEQELTSFLNCRCWLAAKRPTYIASHRGLSGNNSPRPMLL